MPNVYAILLSFKQLISAKHALTTGESHLQTADRLLILADQSQGTLLTAVRGVTQRIVLRSEQRGERAHEAFLEALRARAAQKFIEHDPARTVVEVLAEHTLKLSRARGIAD